MLFPAKKKGSFCEYRRTNDAKQKKQKAENNSTPKSERKHNVSQTKKRTICSGICRKNQKKAGCPKGAHDFPPRKYGILLGTPLPLSQSLYQRTHGRILTSQPNFSKKLLDKKPCFPGLLFSKKNSCLF